MKMKSVPKSHVYVSPLRFTRRHKKEPRGWGTWVFLLGMTNMVEDVFIHTGTYCQSKAGAIAFAASKGIRDIEVMP